MSEEHSDHSVGDTRKKLSVQRNDDGPASRKHTFLTGVRIFAPKYGANVWKVYMKSLALYLSLSLSLSLTLVSPSLIAFVGAHSLSCCPFGLISVLWHHPHQEVPSNLRV